MRTAGATESDRRPPGVPEGFHTKLWMGAHKRAMTCYMHRTLLSTPRWYFLSDNFTMNFPGFLCILLYNRTRLFVSGSIICEIRTLGRNAHTGRHRIGSATTRGAGVLSHKVVDTWVRNRSRLHLYSFLKKNHTFFTVATKTALILWVFNLWRSDFQVDFVSY